MGQKSSTLFTIKKLFHIKTFARHCALLIKTRWENVLRIVFFILVLTNGAVWMQVHHPVGAIANVAPTPAGYWKFDEGSGTTASDSSGNGSTGAITGAGWVAGQVNGALSFNGTTNYVSMGTPTPLKFGTGSFTIMSWFKTSATSFQRMVNMGMNNFSNGFELSFDETGSCPGGTTGCVTAAVGGGSSATSFSVGTTVHTYADGNWHNAALVVDQTGKTAQLYVDGVVQTVTERATTCTTGTAVTSIDISGCGSLNATGVDAFTVGALLVGASTTSNYFSGSLDEVRVYNSALSSTDIVNQYASDTGTSISPQAISVYGQGTGNVFNTNATGTTSSTFNNVRRVVLDSSGGLYESELTNNRVLYFPSGAKTATRVYGQNATGTNFTSGTANLGGSVASTTLNTPKGLALDTAGNLYVVDSGNNRVLFYPISGGIAAVTPTRVYGQGTAGNVFNSATVATTASGMSAPVDVTLDSQNNLYVADASNNRVLYFPSTGGTAGTAAFTATHVYGQGTSFTTGTANQCSCTTDSALTLSNPVAVLVDSSNDLYVADAANNRVVYYPTWTANPMTATRVYGQTTFTGFTANQGGSISATSLSFPYALALDSSNGLYISDNLNHRVLYYPSWTANPMAATRVYGQLGNFTTGTTNHCSCTTASNSSFNQPVGLNLDPTGHLYVADALNNRILEFWTHLAVTTQPPATTPPLNTFSMAASLIDDGSQLVFSDFTGAVAVTITTGTAGATLSGTVSVNAMNGVATFSNLSIDKQGIGYILTVSNAVGGSATTSAFNIATLTLAGYWPLSEGSGTTTADLSGNGDTGTISGATWTTGQVNGALSFTGTTNYVTMGTPTPLKFGASSFTAISWFKTSVTTIGRMVGEGVNNYSTGFDLSVSATSTCSAGCVSAEMGGGSQGTSIAFGTTATTFNNNKWHQAAMVIDQSAHTGQIYVDGVVQSLTKQASTCGTVGTTSIDITLCSSANATNSSDPFTLGAYHSGASTLFAFVGGLDEVRVYNAALTSAQILSQYNVDNTPSPAGYWPLDEGTGLTTADRSSLGTSTGTLSGATLPAWITTGKDNDALSFDGTAGYVTMGTPTALKFGTGSFTFMSWFKVANGYKGHGRMVSLGVNGYLGGFDMEMNLNGACATNGGCIGAEVGSTLGTAAGFLSFYTSGTTGASIYNDGNWHQTAMVIDRTLNTAQIFVDGTAQLVSTQAGDCAAATAAISVNISGCANLTATSGVDPFALGADRSSTTTSSPMTGSLDEVRVYGSALTSTQILNQHTIDASPLTETAANQSFSGSLGTTANYTLPIALTYQLASAPGWHIMITSTTLTSGANTLPNTSSTITGVTGVCTSSGTCLGGVGGDTLTNTVSSGSFPLSIPAAGTAPTAVQFFGAAAGTGKGAYTVTPSISVVIPATVNIGTYTSTITLTAASGP